MKIASHPLWLVGFRPFFLLACLAGVGLPVAWALMFSGALSAPPGRLSPTQWHAHEMFFGFGWAVMGGFLLTATKNWVSVRGYHGSALMALVLAWCFERLGMSWGGGWPAYLFWLSAVSFSAAIVGMLLITLLRHRDQDSFQRDNVFFLVALPAFLVAKMLVLSPVHFEAGVAMTLGLFRLAFLVMMERTLSQFMKGVFQVDLLRDWRLDLPIKGLALVLVLVAWLPDGLAAVLYAALATLLLFRFLFWSPFRAFGRIELAVMYLGYLALVCQLLLEVLARVMPVAWMGSVSVHVFAFGVMGLVIPPMLVRISKGHTGRKVVFDTGDKMLIWIMLLAFFVRIVLPQLFPDAYPHWIHLAAGGWSLCFLILGGRMLPRLMAPRVDGKVH
ncbi:NnrS family protein [Zoogloea sp.]|uniref:NnrS family protein n=1 Tax=Zoogloea sp. TaxID=49181 RepID=UPI002611124E|nr:NnrS family protein [Zoogloea sp.]MDD3352860.1 NnrS family protein [Zoogloea sp.]